MRLILIFAAILALSLAEDSKNEHLEDLVAQETVELMKESRDLHEAASTYNTYVPPSQRPWTPPQNYVPQNTWPQAPQQDPIQPVNYIPPSPPVPPQNDVPQNSGYWPPQNTWKPPHNHPTTTPTTIIKNEQYFGNDGYYYYTYQTSDGTQVSEKGYKNSNKPDDIVKEGWWTYRGQDGKVYTTTWWADSSGFHVQGDHIPAHPAKPKVALDETPKVGDDKKPQLYPVNVNPTQYVQTDYNYPTYPQKPIPYQPTPTYPTYQ